jgi:hypothetical protein
MKKPAPKTEVTINSVHHHVRMIFFDATADAASDFAEFGTLSSPEKTSSETAGSAARVAGRRGIGNK